MLEAIKSTYAIFEQYHISMTGLMVIAILLALAFLFSVREAAAWFFKIDDLKRDIQRLRLISNQLESEIRSLQTLVDQNRPMPKVENARIETASAASRPGSFSIHH